MHAQYKESTRRALVEYKSAFDVRVKNVRERNVTRIEFRSRLRSSKISG